MVRQAQVTLDDIARKLDVSKVTVSKALRDHPDISEATKKKVRHIAKKLGYTPNFMARSLSARCSGTLGLVVPRIAHHFFATAIEAIYERAREDDYDVILMVSQESAERQARNIQTLLSMRVDGLLISAAEDTSDLSPFQLLQKMGVPTVMFDRTVPGQSFSSVTVDDEEGAFKITEHAIKSGFTRLGHLAGYSNTNVGKLRRLGFQKALQKHGLLLRREWVVEGGFSDHDGSAGLSKLCENRELPEAIFAVTYPVALGAHSAARKRGLAIPQDLALVCFGSYYDYFSPAIIRVEQPTPLIGQKAVELLLAQIRHPNKIQRQDVVLRTRFRPGETCPRKRRAAD